MPIKKGHFAFNTIMNRCYFGQAWGDDPAILARVVATLLYDLRKFVGDDYLEESTDQAVKSWKEFRTEQEGH